ncbi:MAG TPA: metal ABC transporter permease [Gemmatimonadaceae bacterium]|nr:metal ABC transporter permease [Gemmatimonadaceae bacterium]
MVSISALLLAIGMAVAAGLVGSIAVMRRMALASDALSHVALPGITLALLLHVNPLLGGLVALVAGTLLVWALEYRTRIPTEAVIGVLFSAALAIGSLMASGEDLIDALLGAPGAASVVETLLGLGATALIIAFMIRARSRMVIRLVSPDLVQTLGVNVARLDLLFLLAFALTVALGLRYLGVLLMGSLIIIPATTAMYLGRSLRAMQLIAISSAVGSTVVGSLVAPRFGIATGPAIIVVAAVVFVLGLLSKRRFAGARDA